MEPLGRFPRVLDGLPREYIEGPPRGFLKKIPKGAFNILPRESFEYSRDLPRGSIIHDITKALPQIVILSRSRRTQVEQTNERH